MVASNSTLWQHRTNRLSPWAIPCVWPARPGSAWSGRFSTKMWNVLMMGWAREESLVIRGTYVFLSTSWILDVSVVPSTLDPSVAKPPNKNSVGQCYGHGPHQPSRRYQKLRHSKKSSIKPLKVGTVLYGKACKIWLLSISETFEICAILEMFMWASADDVTCAHAV